MDWKWGSVAKFSSSLFEVYAKYKGKSVKSNPDLPFWDVVVLTTADAEQQKVFELQLEEKKSRGELPLDIPFHVFSDPPGTKTGNGGATINSLAEVWDIYGGRMENMRVLLIHAGGQSKRLPSASVMGKIFTAIPIGGTVCHLLDVNLAMYLPFLKKMKPGVFIVCADAITPYFLEMDGDWSFEYPGFTVLAHPSTVEIAVKHGVYVLEDPRGALEKTSGTHLCLKVLQKASEDVLRRNGAVLTADNGEEIVFTDSVFYFDNSVTKLFLQFHKDFGPVTCEIDAYADFLQGLGPQANDDYVNNMTNISTVLPELLEMRQKVYNLLKNLRLNTILLNQSKFYHIGTMEEYLCNYCEDVLFQKCLNLELNSFNKITGDSSKPTPNSCKLHNILTSSPMTGEQVVIEFCNFGAPVQVGSNSIVSNCEYDPKSEAACDLLSIPENSFIHTIPVTVKGSTCYVTVFCGIQDDLKKSSSRKEVEKLPFCGKTLLDVQKVWGKSSAEQFYKESASSCSLWTAGLFPAMPSMSSSFIASLSLLQRLSDCPESLPGYEIPVETSWLSVANALECKNILPMLAYRKTLYESIKG